MELWRHWVTKLLPLHAILVFIYCAYSFLHFNWNFVAINFHFFGQWVWQKFSSAWSWRLGWGPSNKGPVSMKFITISLKEWCCESLLTVQRKASFGFLSLNMIGNMCIKYLNKAYILTLLHILIIISPRPYQFQYN